MAYNGGTKYAFTDYVSTCQLYHIFTGRVVYLVDLLQPKKDAAAVWLPDGRIFVIGGSNGSWVCGVEMTTRPWNAINPIRYSWTEATPMPTPIVGPSAALFCDTILVIGRKSAALFSPTSQDDSEPGQWSTLSCPYELFHVFGRDDRIFAIGSSCEIFAFEKPTVRDQTSEEPNYSNWNWKQIAYIDDFSQIVGAAVLPPSAG